MSLGLNRDEVRIVDYDSDWKKEFERIQNQLLSIGLIEKNRIEHIGSTSIPRMRAKPVIDIVIGLDNLNLKNQFEDKLRTFGFYRLKVQREGEIIFAKFKDEKFQIKTHFIHVVIYKGNKWNNFINFRDYLSKHKEARIDYIFLKESYLKNSNERILNYTNYKNNFVKNIIKRCEHE